MRHNIEVKRGVADMLKVIFGDVEEAIYNTSVYFDNTYEEEWITSDFSKKVIFDIDKSEVLSDEYIKSPVLGPITPTKLSGGTKTLILINNNPDMIFNASTCGDNCAKWILQLGKEKDIVINLRHIMDFGDEEFEICIVNTNQVVHSMIELISIAHGLI